MPALYERAGIETLTAFASTLTTLATARTTAALAAFAAPVLARTSLTRIGLTGIALAWVALSGIALAWVALAGIALAGIALAWVALAGIALTGITLSGIALAGFPLAGVCARSQIITHQVSFHSRRVWHSRANRGSQLRGGSLRSATRWNSDHLRSLSDRIRLTFSWMVPTERKRLCLVILRWRR
jgi:hypothetical protein